MPNEMAGRAVEAAPAHDHESPRANHGAPTLRWFVKRAAIGIAILSVSITGMAVLLHAAIDPQLDAINTEGTLLNTIVRMASRF